MEPQAISASYIAELIEVNEQALASLKEMCALKEPILTSEYVSANTSEHHLLYAVRSLKQLHECLVAKENAVEQAERKAKSGLTGRMYE